MNKSGHTHIAPLTEQIIQRLQENDGHLEMSDKSSPEIINAAFGVSKKSLNKPLAPYIKSVRLL